jgi:hypothetical protein
MGHRDQQTDLLFLQTIQALCPASRYELDFPLLITDDFPEQVRIETLGNSICIDKIEGLERENTNSNCSPRPSFISLYRPNTDQHEEEEDLQGFVGQPHCVCRKKIGLACVPAGKQGLRSIVLSMYGLLGKKASEQKIIFLVTKTGSRNV